MLLLTAFTLERTAGTPAYGKLATSVLSLETLERTGPIALAASAPKVELCFSPKGEPLWTVERLQDTAATTFTLDATASALVPVDEACGPEVATTSVTPAAVTHRRPAPEGVVLSEDGLQLDGVDPERPVRATRAILAGAVGWSPGKKRFVYSDAAPRCELAAVADRTAGGLHVWDAARRAATRLPAARGSYQAQWLTDDLLVYESGATRRPRLTVHRLQADGAPLALGVPAGAGLHGLPALGCASAVALVE